MAIITKDTPDGFEASGTVKTLTQERIEAFSGGFPRDAEWPKRNIHTDLDFARGCGLPTQVASGAMFEGYLTELMVDLFGDEWLQHGSMRLAFIDRVAPEDILTAKAVVQAKEDESSGTTFHMEIWCHNQHGVKVVVGASTGFVQ